MQWTWLTCQVSKQWVGAGNKVAEAREETNHLAGSRNLECCIDFGRLSRTASSSSCCL
jgi:hypothetical protein